MPSVGPAALSVLDLAPVAEGSTVGEALRHSIELAQHVERLGYVRHWVAEHHNMPGIASSAPAVLIAHLAAATTTLRVGSGGVMLPNHSPLVIAEQFGTLEALHPGRIDLGIGRAPGTDQITAYALRRHMTDQPDDLPQLLGELRGYFEGTSQRVHATPGEGDTPDIWLLGSSGFSAQLAAALGLPFSFAHHFMPQNTLGAIDLYRSQFQPSLRLENPYVSIGVQVIVAESDERARFLHAPGQLSFLRLRSGKPGRFPTPEEAAAYEYTPAERSFVDGWVQAHIVGSPETVQRELTALQRQTNADELIVTTMVHDQADRLRSYELLAEVFAETEPARAA
jgi:luciferase family oxidoreductase group 1